MTKKNHVILGFRRTNFGIVDLSGRLDSRPVIFSTANTPSRAQIGVFFFASGRLDSRPVNLPTCKKNKSRVLTSHVIFFLQVELLTAAPPFCPLTQTPQQPNSG